MNFKNLYLKTQNRLKDSVLSLWASGDAEMQQYFSAILDKEGLMADPVFQTAFPWESIDKTFEATNDIFNDAFIKALDGVENEEYRFPKDRKPYKHQVESWNTLINQKQSIAVTTGTGSGKTECFMLPVLYDIYKNHRNSKGVNAIFLYPLNALIGSQKKRIDAWCRALGGINYAIYNGNTLETAKANDARNVLPELISRKQIRETPPQILFTNPSMLEYILVRNKDVDLLNNSEGTLRWILLDEAHTLKGSSAAEMALLIRRVIDAFKVDVNQLRFAITSATVGTGEKSEQQLKTFMANLCGIKEDNIKVITGHRILPQVLKQPTDSIKHFSDIIYSKKPESFKEVQKLRNDILAEPALPLLEIGKRFKIHQTKQQLELIDFLSERKVDDKSILPVRGHFFTRGIGGVYVCTNPECKEHNDCKPSRALGTMTTIAGRICKCGWPMLELVACRSCGNQLLESEKAINRKTGDEQIQMVTTVSQDPFMIENSDDDEDSETVPSTVNKFYFTRNFPNAKYINGISHFSISNEGKIIRPGNVFVEAGHSTDCPHCGSEISNPLHFRLSSSFINRVLADIFLEETPDAERQTNEMLWKGHKYISFTDSRQGTAKISALINQDNEAKWIRSQVYHKLCEIKKEWKVQNPQIPEIELKQIIVQLESELATTIIPILKSNKQKQIDEYKAQLNNSYLPSSSANLGWTKLKNYLNTQTDFQTLFYGNNPNDSNPNARGHYLTAILFDQFARRLPRQNSLENLGMVSLVYPKLQNVTLPIIAESLAISLNEWKDLLKIAADYVLRYSFYFFLSYEIDPYTTSFIRSQTIYNPNAEEVNVKRWTMFDRKRKNQNRLALLICAGLGFHEREDIDAEDEDQINELLKKIWETLKSSVLRPDNNGYKLDIEEATAFQLSENLWLCPVKKKLIDAQFRGYSPWIKGNLTIGNIRHYKIDKHIQFPEFPYPFNIDDEKNPDLDKTREWIIENALKLREQGVWNNLHEQIILNHPLYFSGEHSAQQHEKRLLELEDKFEKGKINILNCSTTMEMGVDIGGISAVIMNNVPPSPANYLQRAGRAGRRAEQKSFAFTICSPTPVGLNAIENPMWALNHLIAPPFISFKSEMVVERHLNAFFLGKFVQTDQVKGLNVRIDTEVFFFKEEDALATLFSNWLLNNDVRSYEKAVKTIIENTPLEDRSFHYLLSQVIDDFQKLTEKTIKRKNGFEEKLNSMSVEFGEKSPAYKAVEYQRNQFVYKNAIGYLAEEGFLPTAGLPTGIVEFDTLNIDDINKKIKNKSKPSYFITRALSEFAPGKQIVIDGKSYKSEGIILKNDRGVQAQREIVQSCSHCGYQRIIEVSNNENVNSECPHCSHTSFKGINFKDSELPKSTYTEMIQPAGFAIDIYQTPSRKISEISSIQYIDPILINIKPWQNKSSSLFEVRESEGNAEILFYNVGNGNGYAVCLHCGRTGSDRSQLDDHKRLRGGKNSDNERNAICSGNEAPHAIHEHVILGGRFKTDFCEIRFREDNSLYSKDETLLHTLGAVLSKELSHFLAIEEGEIGFGIKRYDQFSTVFIFDTAKGGAGYSSQFMLYADDIFKIAEKTLFNCDCDKACTKCLIDRHTQWHLDLLDRHRAWKWLSEAISIKVPDEYLTLYPHLKILIGSIKDEVGRLSYANKISEIRLYGSSDISAWDLEKITFINKLRHKVKIQFVLDEQNRIYNVQEKISLIQISAWSEIWRQNPTSEKILRPICRIQTNDGEVIEYLTENFENTFNENWGDASGGIIYKNSNAVFENLKRIDTRIDEQNNFTVAITEKDTILSNQIVDLILTKLSGKTDLKTSMQNQSFKVTYSDRYLKTPLGCLLMVQFIDRLKDLLDFKIESLDFKGQDFREDRGPNFIFNNFKNAHDRNNAVIELAKQLNISNSVAVNEELPHYRYFEFKSKDVSVIFRPDAGVAYDWFLSNSEKVNFKMPMNAKNNIQIYKKSSNDLLYNVSVEKISEG